MVRSWPAPLAWGAGLIHLALGAAVVRGGADVATAVVLGALLALGSIEISWGVLALRRGRPPTPRLAVCGALAATALGVGALVIGASPLAGAAASLLAVTAAAVAVRLYGSRARPAFAHRRRPALASLVIGAVLTAGIATPALATTEAGLHAPSHDHGTAGDPHVGH